MHVLLELFHLHHPLLLDLRPLLTGGPRTLQIPVSIVLIELLSPLLRPNSIVLRFQRFLNFRREVRFQLQLLVAALVLVQAVQVGSLAGGHGRRLYSLKLVDLGVVEGPLLVMELLSVVVPILQRLMIRFIKIISLVFMNYGLAIF